MNFPFQHEKATQCAALFIQKEGGSTTILKLVKLLYLAERKSFETRGVPIFGGKYFSLPHGPITSEGLDLMNLKGVDTAQIEWNKVVHPRNKNSIDLIEQTTHTHLADYEDLSPAEIKIIEQTYNEHGKQSATQLRNWCHKHLPEYKEVSSGSKPITLNQLAQAVGVNPTHIREEAQAANFIANAFS